MTTPRTSNEMALHGIKNAITDLKSTTLGQHGSAFNDSGDAVTPPAGKVIVAIQFLGTMTLSALVAEGVSGSESVSSATNGAGSGGEVIDSSNKFPSGALIYGRWTSVTCVAQSTGGIIVYFGY